MESKPLPSFEMPSFLYGSYAEVHRKATKEGRRCATQYQKDGTFLVPREVLPVKPGSVVLMDGAIDFTREQPAWRLYLLSDVREGLYKALDWKGTSHAREQYEACFRETAWGALHYAITYVAPMDVVSFALRFKSVLRFWDALQTARYLFTSPDALLTLDELMMATCDWAMDAWGPAECGSVRTRLEGAVERMSGATKEDSIKAILRQLPRVLAATQGLKHREVLADPAFWNERLTMLDPESFNRISAASTANVLERLHLWDRQLETLPQ
jgi:hypothetical protein